MHNPNRVLFVDHQVFRGGGEVIVELLATKLRDYGYEIAICGSPGSALEEFCGDEKIEFLKLDIDSKFVSRKHSDGIIGTVWSLVRTPVTRTIRSLAYACTTFRPDIVHVHTLKSAVLLFPVILWSRLRQDFKTIYIYHDHTLTFSLFHMIIGKLFNTVICVSETVARKYSMKLSGHKLNTIWNGISEDILNVEPVDLRKRLGLPVAVPIIAFTGRIIPGKGVHVLIEALSLLRARGYQFHALIIGFSPRSAEIEYQKWVKDLVGVHNLEDCTSLVDFLPRDTSLRFVAGSDIVVIPSVEPESFGLAALEGIVLGRTVVGTDAGGLRDVLLTGGGIIASPGDVDSLASGIEEAIKITQAHTDGSRTSMGSSILLNCKGLDFVKSVDSVYRTYYEEASIS